jgi:hypothetical protein
MTNFHDVNALSTLEKYEYPQVKPVTTNHEALPVELTGPICAIDIIVSARKQVSTSHDYPWSKLYNAAQYLNKQIEAYFAPEAA